MIPQALDLVPDILGLGSPRSGFRRYLSRQPEDLTNEEITTCGILGLGLVVYNSLVNAAGFGLTAYCIARASGLENLRI